VERHPHLDAAVLEDEDVLDVLARPELGVTVAPHPDERLRPLRLEAAERALVLVRVDDDLGVALRRDEGGEAILEHGDLEGRLRDLGDRASRPGRAEGAVGLARQEGALLPVHGVHDLLAAQLVVAALAHTAPEPPRRS
jgi:hypothetical protein